MSEGSNGMTYPAVSSHYLHLDAGTYATMGVGLGYTIAAHRSTTSHEASSGEKVLWKGAQKLVSHLFNLSSQPNLEES